MYEAGDKPLSYLLPNVAQGVLWREVARNSDAVRNVFTQLGMVGSILTFAGYISKMLFMIHGCKDQCGC